MGKAALVFGSTGLVGGHLTGWLQKSDSYDKIILFQRRLTQVTDKKTRIELIDYERLDDFARLFTGDDIFCCLGTTMRKAGSKDAFRKVDLEYPVHLAKIGKNKGIQGFFVVSSIGANLNTANFYLHTKAEMELEIQKLEFNRLAVFRPSLLLGKREEYRFGERLSQRIYPLFHWILQGSLKKFRGIKASDVARAMVIVASKGYQTTVIESDKIYEISKTGDV